MALTIHFDGLCLPKNPGGVATYGFVAKRGAKLIHEEGGLAAPPYTPQATNNVAEYTGVLKALEWALAQGFENEKLIVRGDSELVIKQLKGEYKVKSPSIVGLFTRVRDLAAKFSSISFGWVPREENKDADAMTNRAYAEFGARKKSDRRREDESARIRRGFSIEIETPAAASDAFRALTHPTMPKGKVESSLPPNILILNHDDGSTSLLSVIRLSNGARIRCEHSRPAGDENEVSLRSAEPECHAPLLGLQSRLETRAP